jgi:hypothetical protein
LKVHIGSSMKRSKLSEDDVRAIRLSNKRNFEAALEYGVDKSTISTIRSRKIWTHVE